ncbi:MAG: hypothetical protein A2W03_08700 [Candidatus Aminicenantes bacterium RBG_16_63_16]|nr:MAG: hypothetical protein A2W03_08700 [Candidatus Aminicenantes bacterium RBG_16_63_16]
MLLLAAGLVFLLVRPASGFDGRGLNLLVVTLDTVRADRLGCYGDRLARTPAIDALAGRGVLFQDCYTSVPLTLPAHCTLFTGRWPFALGVRNNAFYALDPGELTLAERLKADEYDTSALVASYVLKERFGLNQGFDLYDDRLGYEEKAGSLDAEIPADQVYRKFQAWLAGRGGQSQPFFLWVHFFDPHKPYAPPAEYLKLAGGDAYRGEVAFVDYHVGRIIDDLRERKLLDRTLIVLVGDHGEAFGEHQENGHGIFCYEESIRVPLVFFNPALFSKPRLVRQRVRLVDVMPTLLEILKAGDPRNSQGKSLVELMRGREEKTPRPVYLESLYGTEAYNWAPLTAWVSGSLKYISLPQAELYDLQTDPLERDNLLIKRNRQARELDLELARFINDQRAARPSEKPRPILDAEERKKLESLGYVSSFAASSRTAIDPKIGVRYQNRIIELIAQLDSGDVDRVEREAEKLVEETRPLKFPYAYALLNLVYERKKDWGKLEDGLLRAFDFFKDDPIQSVAFKGDLLAFYFADRQYNKAESLAEDILKSSPDHVKALEILGLIQEDRQDWATALKSYLRAREIEPRNASLSKHVLGMRLKLKDRPAAQAEIESLLTTDDGARDPDLLFTAATLSFEAGDRLRAEELLRRVAELRPSAHSLYDHALVLGMNGKTAEAVERMKQALAFTPSDLDEEKRATALKALQRWNEKLR